MFKRARRLFQAVSALFLAIAAMPAQAQTADWFGFGYLYNFSPSCAANGWTGTARYNVRYRPANLGGNGNWSGLSFFDRNYAFGFTLPAARFDRTWRVVEAGGIGASPYNWSATTEARVRVQTQTPTNANLRLTTPQIRMVGQIRGFETMADCTASFEATLIRRR